MILSIFSCLHHNTPRKHCAFFPPFYNNNPLHTSNIKLLAKLLEFLSLHSHANLNSKCMTHYLKIFGPEMLLKPKDSWTLKGFLWVLWLCYKDFNGAESSLIYVYRCTEKAHYSLCFLGDPKCLHSCTALSFSVLTAWLAYDKVFSEKALRS